MAQEAECGHDLVYVVQDLAGKEAVSYCVRCNMHVPDISADYSKHPNLIYRKKEFEFPVLERNKYATKATKAVSPVVQESENLHCYTILTKQGVAIKELTSYLQGYGNVKSYQNGSPFGLIKLESTEENAEKLYQDFKNKNKESPLNHIQVFTDPNKQKKS